MELTEEELDFNMITKNRYSLKTLQELKEKYKNVSYMQEAIKEALKEIENEHNR